MKRVAMFSFAFNLVLIIFILSSNGQALGKVVGQLGMVEGEVFVDSNPVQKSAKVNEGSVIEVKDGRATLILGRGSVFHLAADSKMVINEFGVKPQSKDEVGELDLKFGRTRALILNKGGEKKELKIKARAATMGVRGTEIFIDAPKDSKQSIQFFTLEGKAEVKAHPAAAPVTVNQNQGVAASGVAPPPAAAGSTGGSGASGGGGNSGSGGAAGTAGSAGGGSAGAGGSNGSSGGASAVAGAAGPADTGTTATTLSISDVKNEIKNSGMSGVPAMAPGMAPSRGTSTSLNDSFGIGAVAPIVLDPIQDKNTPFTIQPTFCNATGAGCP